MATSSGKTFPQSRLSSYLSRTVKYLSKVVDPLAGTVAAIIAGIILAAMMFLTFVDVSSRLAVNTPLNGTLELTEFMMALLVCFGLGYCAREKGHIRVDLVMQYMPVKAKIWLEIVCYGCSAFFYILVTWQTWIEAWSKISSNLTTGVLHIPVYPFFFFVGAGAFIAALVFLRDFFKSIEEMMK